MIPSGIQRSKELPLRLQQVRPGLYVVKNAYAGVFEFFRERAAAGAPGGSASADKGRTHK